ncbi:MAG: TolC family protein [Kofleriaceae bacterium]|nr:TolC family protein [Kofleriaceae bacterium]
MNNSSLPRFSSFLSVIIFGLGVTSGDASAQEHLGKIELPESASRVTVRKLSLTEAIKITLKNNLGIALQRQQVSMSEASIRSSEAGFEPLVTARLSHNDSISPPSTSLDGTPGSTFENSSQQWSLGVSKRLSFGTNLGVNFSSSRRKSNLGSAVEPLFYGSNLSLSVSQPLLRGFSFDRDIPRSAILLAKFSNQRALQETRIAMAREIRQTENAYWNLVQTTRSYGVQKASLELARDQYDITQRKIKAGLSAPADLISSESSVAQRELALLQSDANLEASMDVLRSTMNMPDKDWSDFLLATDLPEVSPVDLDLELAMSLALQTRPEMQQNRIEIQRQELSERVAKNSNLPDLNLGFSYGVVGQSNVYRTTISQLDGLGARDWGVFLNLSWAPLGQAASANVDSLQAQDKILALRQKQFLSGLRAQLRAAIRNLQTAERQVNASVRFRELATRSLEIERKRFMSSMSRNIEVSQRENELAAAQTAEISARIDFQRAKSDLDLATGSLLKNRGIELSVR